MGSVPKNVRGRRRAPDHGVIFELFDGVYGKGVVGSILGIRSELLIVLIEYWGKIELD